VALGVTLSRPAAHRTTVEAGPSRTTYPLSPAPPVELVPPSTSTALPAGTIIGGRFTRAITLDGGALIIEPPPASTSAKFPIEQADQIIGAAQPYNPGKFTPGDTGLGIVDLADSVAPGLPAYTDRAAWIAVVGPDTNAAVSCPGASGGIAPVPTVDVIIVDAQSGGDVLDYRSKGNGPCGGTLTGPSAKRAEETVSIPWTAVGDQPVSEQQFHQLFPPNAVMPKGEETWVITYTIPRCAMLFDSPGIYEQTTPVLYIEVQEPISPPATCAPSKTVTQSFGPEDVPVSEAGHAPTGVDALNH
jgi:hypothetical protein